MNIKEAFDILGLDITASKSEIKEHHRSLIKSFHSDKENGNHEKSSLINNAREVTLKYIDEKNNVSLIKQVVDIVSINNNKISQQTEYKEQSNSLHTKISRKIREKYKSYKSTAKTFGLISASIALLTSKLLPLVPEDSNDPNLTISFAIISVVTGIIYLVVNSIAEKIQDSIDDLKDTLSDKGSYYDILNDILNFQEIENQIISRSEFEELCRKWFHFSRYRPSTKFSDILHESLNFENHSITKTVARIGINDFVKYIISKGLEKNILIEKESMNNGRIEIKYEINQKAGA